VEIPPPPKTRVAHFSHAGHLKLGNVAGLIAAAIDAKTYLSPPGEIRRQLDSANACEACHRGLRESDKVSAANMPQMADCLVCHNRIDIPVSCEKCHERGAALKPANHTPEFLDTHTTGKLGLDKVPAQFATAGSLPASAAISRCADCKVGRALPAVQNRVPPCPVPPHVFKFATSIFQAMRVAGELLSRWQSEGE
jgi:hypothetical protein